MANRAVHFALDAEQGPTCGLIPIGARAERVTTRGLKWNLDRAPLAFGELVSSSNSFADDTCVVEVETSQPLLYVATLSDWPSQPGS